MTCPQDRLDTTPSILYRAARVRCPDGPRENINIIQAARRLQTYGSLDVSHRPSSVVHST